MVETAETTRMRKTPLAVSGIVLAILRNYLRANSVAFVPGPSRLGEDLTEESALLLTTHDDFDFNRTQVRPAVVVKRGDITYSRIVMNNLMGFEDGTASKRFVKQVNGSYTMLCISKVPGECERLAEEVSEVLLGFEEVIRKDFMFQVFEYRGTGELGILQENREFSVVPCSVNLQWEENWVVTNTSAVSFGGVSVVFGPESGRVNDAFGDEIYPTDPVAAAEAAAEALYLKKQAGAARCGHEPDRVNTSLQLNDNDPIDQTGVGGSARTAQPAKAAVPPRTTLGGGYGVKAYGTSGYGT